MAFRQPTFNLGGASGNNKHLNTALRSLHERLDQLEQRTGTVAADTSKHAPIAPAPPPSRVKATAAGAGQYVVEITNPEFFSRGNMVRTPLYHRVSYSTAKDFSRDVTRLDPSPQTHFTIVDPRPRLFFQVQSSEDGVNWS